MRIDHNAIDSFLSLVVVVSSLLLELRRLFLELLQFEDWVTLFCEVVFKLCDLLLHILLVVLWELLSLHESLVNWVHSLSKNWKKLFVLLLEALKAKFTSLNAALVSFKPVIDIGTVDTMLNYVLHLLNCNHSRFLVNCSLRKDIRHVSALHLCFLCMKIVDEGMRTFEPWIHFRHAFFNGSLLSKVQMPLSPEDVHDLLAARSTRNILTAYLASKSVLIDSVVSSESRSLQYPEIPLTYLLR